MEMVVVDTNVIYSALRSRRGSAHRLLLFMAEGSVHFGISAALIFEYEDVLKRETSELVFSESEVDEILNALIALGRRFSSHFLWRPHLKDAKDDMVLELAVVSGSKEIITFNIKDFKRSETFGIQAITPLEYLKREKML